MKCFFFLFLISVPFMYAQTSIADSAGSAASADSVNLQEIVRQQIEAAKLKNSAAEQSEVYKASGPVELLPVQTEANNNIFSKIPLQRLIFLTGSVLIISALVLRRTLISLKQKSSKELKTNIAALREEKVAIRRNLKLSDIRKKLRGRKSIFDASDTQISKLAKQLKVSKGELLLASRLKLFEIGKM